ncbi:hypothetical protein WS1362 [Wolinella succinogenes]|uniref:Uncharacterized protein n=2 Tax=Wolinella succinogenes TaxID=844 RepID=Q7MRH1_WOLSU|nr:hypothetical protein WS1362 [Wolinella succinogenes]VEG80557.1 Uncharacterised protein [Wolinella succinogenes]
MSMRKIQSKLLPNDWLKRVKDFDIDKSSLSDSQKTISKYIKGYIITEKENSLSDSLSVVFIKYVIFNNDFLLNYNDLPINLIENAMNELNGMSGLEFSKKLHSIFIEFMTYQKFYEFGYVINTFNRDNGSCDLVMNKNNETFNIEVKFKENDDISISRLFDIIDGFSLLNKNGFVRDLFLEINLKVENINKYKTEIIAEIRDFFQLQYDVYNGNYLQIFNSKKRNQLNRDIHTNSLYISKFIISDELEDLIHAKRMIKKLFIGKDRHITNLIKKSSEYQNFIGCLSWAIPFHNSVDFKIIELAFRELLDLDFDLHIFISHMVDGEYHFILKK